jgi:tetratricopeptide (TPR) repeat protein
LATGHPTEACPFAESARDIAETLEEFPLQVCANVYLGGAYLAAGDAQRAEAILRKVMNSLQGDLVRERFGMVGFPAVMSRFFLVLSLAERGAFAEGITTGQEAVRAAEALDHPYSLAVAYWRLGYVYGVKGDFSQAVPLLERSVGAACDGNLPLLSAFAGECLGYVYALSGRTAEGLALLDQAVKAMESMGSWQFGTLGLVHLGEACLLVNQLQEAAGSAVKALTLIREGGQRGYEAWALRLLGEIASHRDPHDAETAEVHYRQALALADELGMRPLVAHCHLGLGTLYRRAGKRDLASEHLTTAATMYREMDMRFWLEQAGPEMRDLGE